MVKSVKRRIQTHYERAEMGKAMAKPYTIHGFS